MKRHDESRRRRVWLASLARQWNSMPSWGHSWYAEDLPICGTKATLNVWNPVVELGDDFSLAQIWVTSGTYENKDNTLETGWQVSYRIIQFHVT
ncbi:unnamed protein product [Brassica rapa subsp. narinosa]